ncbi:MAG: RnfABCDGE type electron transport complex subunit D [Erysipelotrichaceae bacterium]
MKFTFSASPNLHQKKQTKNIMAELTIGLLIVYAFSLYFYYTRYDMSKMVQCLILMATSIGVAIVTEGAYAYFTKQNIVKSIFQGGGLVTAIILTLMCSVNITPYALGVATFFALFFGKLIFGGFGQNIFNPAAFGRAVIFLAFATASTDVITGVTPTTLMATTYNWLPVDPALFDQMLQGVGGLTQMFTGWYAGALGETSALLLLIVGIVLAIRKVIDWRVPALYIGSVFVLACIIGLSTGMSNWLPYALFHILSGGVFFGAVFMLTDPVTSPTSAAGRNIFAIGAAIITVLIRIKANYPEGVLFSILIMNMLTPMIEKALDGNQLRNRKKAGLIFGVVALLGIGTTILAASTIEPAKAAVEESKPAMMITLQDEYTNTLQAQIDSTSDNGDGTTTYLVTSQGFASVEGPKMEGYDHPSEPNQFAITINNNDQSIKSVKVTVMKDTEWIGDKILDESFLKQFIGVKLSDDFKMEVNDAVSGATYSSKSTLRAIIEVRKTLGY